MARPDNFCRCGVVDWFPRALASPFECKLNAEVPGCWLFSVGFSRGSDVENALHHRPANQEYRLPYAE